MNFSRRAKILSEVLEFINSDDWAHHGDFLIFGKDAFERSAHGVFGERIDDSAEHEITTDSLRKLGCKLKVDRGDREVAQRVSLNAPPKDSSMADITDWFFQLPVEERKFVSDALKSLHSQENYASKSDVTDDVDAALASAALRKLEDSAGRLSSFDQIGPIAIGSRGPRGAEYFEEAHGCDLDGYRIATAVLCRAMLEAALIETTDPNGKIKQNLKPEDSYIGEMIKKAERLHLLNSLRARAAVEIRDAGNHAIHNLPKFKKEYALRMRCKVDELRAILVDLYQQDD